MPTNSRISGLRDHTPEERLALVVEGAGHCVRRDRRAQFLAILDEALAAADAR